MSYVFNKEVIGMTYKQNENSKTSLNDSLEKRTFHRKEPSSLNLHELQIDHTAVNMTDRYIKAHPNFSRLGPSSVKLHDVEIGHTTVNMTERYIKAHPNFSRLGPLSVKLHDVEIGHTTVNMTERYIKAHPNDSRLEAYKSILLSSSNQLSPMSASQCRHELSNLYFSELLTKKRK